MDQVNDGSSHDSQVAIEEDVMNEDVDQAIAVAPEVPIDSESDNTPLAYPDLLNVQSNSSNLTSSAPSLQDIDRQPKMRVSLNQSSNGTQLPLNRPNVVHDHQSSVAPSIVNANPQRPSRAVGPSVSASSGAIPKIGMNRQRPGGPPDVSVVNAMPSTSRNESVGNNDSTFGGPGTARSSVTVEPYVVRNSRSPEIDRVERIEQEIASLQTSRTSFERRVCQTIETIPNQMAAIVSSVQRLQSNIETMVATVNERMNQLEGRLNNLTISTESSNGAECSSTSGRIAVMDPSSALIREELRNFLRNQRRDMAAERAGYLMAISEALKAVAGVDTENVDVLNQRHEDEDLHDQHHHHLHPSNQMNGPSSSGL